MDEYKYYQLRQRVAAVLAEYKPKLLRINNTWCVRHIEFDVIEAVTMQVSHRTALVLIGRNAKARAWAMEHLPNPVLYLDSHKRTQFL